MNLRKSVKVRLTVWYACVLTVFLFAFSIFTHFELKRALHQDVDQSLAFEARTAESSWRNYLEKKHRLISDPIPVDWLIKQLNAWESEAQTLSQSRRMVQMMDLNHTVLLSNFNDWQKGIILPDFERDAVFMEQGKSFQTIHFEKKPMRLHYRMVREQNQPLFLIQTGRPLDEVISVLGRQRMIILLTIPGVVAIACLAGWMLAKRSFSPVHSMISKAHEITAAYLKERLPRTYAEDELDQLADTLNQMMDRIESSTRAIQDFSSDISHELKTPLAIMRGEIDLAMRKSRSTEELLNTLKIIGEEVDELTCLVNDLLMLMRSDAKQLQFVKVRIALQDVLLSVGERFQKRSHEKGIELISDLAGEANIEGDTSYLKRLFSNLIDNAIKFTPEGGRVRLSMKTEPNKVIVEVEDTGSGMDQEVQSKVFSRFYRADQARSEEGTGLGLNIAKAIVDAHRGEISIQSQPGQGTQIRVIFPLF